MNPRELILELRGTRCRCGAPKTERQTFCHSCYYALMPSQRQALYQRIGEGYEQAYAAAEMRLDNLNRVRQEVQQ